MGVQLAFVSGCDAAADTGIISDLWERSFWYRRGFFGGGGFFLFYGFLFLGFGVSGDGSQLDRGALVCFSSFFSALHRGIGFRDFSKG